MRTPWQRRLDRWAVEVLIGAEIVLFANVLVIASVVYALEYVAIRLERRVSGRSV